MAFSRALLQKSGRRGLSADSLRLSEVNGVLGAFPPLLSPSACVSAKEEDIYSLRGTSGSRDASSSTCRLSFCSSSRLPAAGLPHARCCTLSTRQYLKLPRADNACRELPELHVENNPKAVRAKSLPHFCSRRKTFSKAGVVTGEG